MKGLSVETRQYAEGTELTVLYPWGLYHGGRAMCADGKVRKLKRIAQTADTFFSIPAAVNVGKATVSGYVTTTENADGEERVDFIAYRYGKNGHLLREWMDLESVDA